MCGHNHTTMIKMHSFFLSPKNLNSLNYQAILILKWITSSLFHLQYHNWGETLEQDTKPPTAPRALLHECLPTAPGECSWCVCALGWVKCRAQTLIMGHHIWPHTTSLSLNLFMSGCANHFTPDCFLNEGQFKADFVKKLKLEEGSLPQKREAGWAVLISM